MSVTLSRFIKGARFTQEFDLVDAIDQVIPKVGPGSVIGNAIAAASPPPATDTTFGTVKLNQGTVLPADATNNVDALTALGFNTMANQTGAGTPNAIQQSITNAIEAGIGTDTGAQAAIAAAIADEVAALIPAATDTVQGKVALNLGTVLPADATNSTDALTASGHNALLNDASVTGGNPAQKAVVNAVEQALASDIGAQAAIADAIKDDIATAIANSPADMAKLTAAIPDAADTVKGKVSLAVAANYPSTSDVEAVTPAYLTSAVTAALSSAPVATDTVQGKVALNLGTALPGDTTNATDALTAAGFNTMANATGAGTPNAVQAAVAKAAAAGLANDTAAQAALAASLVDTVTVGVVAGKIASKQALTPSVATGHKVADWTVNGVATVVNETVTTLAVSGVNYSYTNESGVATPLLPAQFASSDAGNAIGVGTDGRLKVVIPAQLPDDQTFTGDASGTVGLVMTPVVDSGTGNTNYTVKADLKVAATTPTGSANLLKWSASGYYASPEEIQASLTDIFGT